MRENLGGPAGGFKVAFDSLIGTRECRDPGLKRDFESPKQGAISPADGGVIIPGISTEETAREDSSRPRRAAQRRSGARSQLLPPGLDTISSGDISRPWIESESNPGTRSFQGHFKVNSGCLQGPIRVPTGLVQTGYPLGIDRRLQHDGTGAEY